MKRCRTAVRSLLRKACHRPTPPPDITPKIATMVQGIEELRRMFESRLMAAKEGDA